MRDQLMELRRRVYRRSISKGVGVIEAIDEILTEVRDEEEKRQLKWLRAVIDAYRKSRPRRRRAARPPIASKRGSARNCPGPPAQPCHYAQHPAESLLQVHR
jgi:hypothetical protein